MFHPMEKEIQSDPGLLGGEASGRGVCFPLLKGLSGVASALTN